MSTTKRSLTAGRKNVGVSSENKKVRTAKKVVTRSKKSPRVKTAPRKRTARGLSAGEITSNTMGLGSDKELLEHAFASGFAHFDGGVGMISSAGKWVNANGLMCKIAGLNHEDLAGRSVSNIDWVRQPYSRKSFLQLVKEVSETHHVATYHVSREMSGADMEWFSVRLIPITNHGKGNYGVLMLMSDVTAEHIAKQTLLRSEANLRTIFNNTDSAIVVLDSMLKVQACNAIAKEWSLSGFKFKLHEGVEFTKLTKDPVLRELVRVAREIIDGKGKDLKTTYFDSGEESRFYQISINAVYDSAGVVIGVQLMAADITVARQAEHDRSRILEDLVRQNKDLEQFNYIVTHNLRSPAGNIVGLASLLQKEAPGTPEFNKCIELILLASQKLNSVTQDLNAILNNKKSISENKSLVDLQSVVDDVHVGMRETLISQKAVIETNFEHVKELLGVKSYLHSIFFNLISNSIKYRHADRNPVISIRSMHSSSGISIRFKDNGLGIDLVSYGDQVFGLYKRFHSDGEGKGMGLFMVKTQVESMGGRITVRSLAEGGTEFVMVF